MTNKKTIATITFKDTVHTVTVSIFGEGTRMKSLKIAADPPFKNSDDHIPLLAESLSVRFVKKILLADE